jgi:hypothetical protein
MRPIRLPAAAAVAAFVVVVVPALAASPAGATLEGPCTASGQVSVNGVAKTGVIDPRTTNSTKIPRKGVVHWKGTAGSGKRPISGKVQIELPPPIGKVTIGSWGGSSGSHANAGNYKYDFPSVLLGLKVPVSGEHHEPRIDCSGSITVQLDGSPIKNPVLIASLVLTVLALLNVALVVRARPA